MLCGVVLLFLHGVSCCCCCCTGWMAVVVLLHGVVLLFLHGVGCHGFAVVFARGRCHCS